MRENKGKKDGATSVPKSISFPPDMYAKVEEVVKSQHGGNLSRYIQSLIEADLSGKSADRADESSGEHIIEELAAKWHPTMLPEIRAMFPESKGAMQPKLLARIIEAAPSLISAGCMNALNRAGNEHHIDVHMAYALDVMSRGFKMAPGFHEIIDPASSPKSGDKKPGPGKTPWAEKPGESERTPKQVKQRHSGSGDNVAGDKKVG